MKQKDKTNQNKCVIITYTEPKVNFNFIAVCKDKKTYKSYISYSKMKTYMFAKTRCNVLP